MNHKELNSFAEKTQRYSRQISCFQHGQYTKDALHPIVTPELLRHVKEHNSWMPSHEASIKPHYPKQHSLEPNRLEVSALI